LKSIRAAFRSQEDPMNQDELDGKGNQVKGKAKQAWGDLTDDERLHDEGVADETAGNVQEGFGKARRKVGEALDDVADKIKE
jgi:uncharacterized protein YjbJ (UPF0337 family)